MVELTLRVTNCPLECGETHTYVINYGVVPVFGLTTPQKPKTVRHELILTCPNKKQNYKAVIELPENVDRKSIKIDLMRFNDK